MAAANFDENIAPITKMNQMFAFAGARARTLRCGLSYKDDLRQRPGSYAEPAKPKTNDRRFSSIPLMKLSAEVHRDRINPH